MDVAARRRALACTERAMPNPLDGLKPPPPQAPPVIGDVVSLDRLAPRVGLKPGLLQKPRFTTDIVVKLGEVAQFRLQDGALRRVGEPIAPPALPEGPDLAGPPPGPIAANALAVGAPAVPAAPPPPAYGRIAQKRVGAMNAAAVDEHLGALHAALAAVPSARIMPHFRRDPDALSAERQRMQARAAGRLADPNAFYTVSTPDGTAPADVERLRAQIAASPLVEFAFVAPIPHAPHVDIAPTTALLAGQGYLDPAPSGIDARFAWSQPGGKGTGVQVVDVEGSWNLQHEDAPDLRAFDGAGIGSWSIWDDNHGTAVLGVIAAGDNAYGFTGVAPDASVGVCTWARLSQVAGAIDDAAAHLQPGDVLLVEVHLPGPTSAPFAVLTGDQTGFVPVEYYPDIADTIRRAVARGIVVVEAAGNGGVDLDLPLFATRISDTGAIMVGAGTPRDRVPEWFTNHGARVDVHAWGDGVATLGYGDVRINGDDRNQFYTLGFSGTSSASAIVAGACAAIQGARQARGLPRLDSPGMRALLRDTGTPQANDPRHIGPLPDLRRAIGGARVDPPHSHWPALPAPAAAIVDAPALISAADRRLWAFFISADGIGYGLSQTAPNGPWAAQASPLGRQDGPRLSLVGRPSVIRADDGGLEVFARSNDGHLWHIWQTNQNGVWGAWSGWHDLGGNVVSDVGAAVNADGRMEVAVLWGDRTMKHDWHVTVRGAWFSELPFCGFGDLGGVCHGRPCLARNRSGRLEILTRGEGERVFSRAQNTPGSEWGPWGLVGNGVLAGDPVALLHPASGRLLVVGLGTDHRLWAIAQSAPDGGYGGPNAGWSPLQTPVLVEGARPALIATAAGEIEVFARQQDGQIGHARTSSGVPGNFTPWAALGGDATSDPAVGMNSSGALEVVARSASGLIHRVEPF
jgi:hypothetical protein